MDGHPCISPHLSPHHPRPHIRTYHDTHTDTRKVCSHVDPYRYTSVLLLTRGQKYPDLYSHYHVHLSSDPETHSSYRNVSVHRWEEKVLTRHRPRHYPRDGVDSRTFRSLDLDDREVLHLSVFRERLHSNPGRSYPGRNSPPPPLFDSLTRSSPRGTWTGTGTG